MSITDALQGMTVAVLGGTGPQGRGLARRFDSAGFEVVIGSRSAEKRPPRLQVSRAASRRLDLAAATAGDIVVVAVPWSGHAELLHHLAPTRVGKIVVDCVNPLGFDKQGAYALPVEGGRRHNRPLPP